MEDFMMPMIQANSPPRAMAEESSNTQRRRYAAAIEKSAVILNAAFGGFATKAKLRSG